MKTVRVAALCLCTAVAAGSGGCTLSNDDLEFLYALPSKESLQAVVPGTGTATSQSGLGQRRDGLAVGDPSKAYSDTLGGSDGFNGILFNVLDILEHVRTKVRPSERSEDRRVWGPFNDEKSRARHFRLVMERHLQPNGQFNYVWQVQVKRKADGEDAWVEALCGVFNATDDVRRGAGHFTFDPKAVRDAGLAPPDDDPKLERLEVTYVTDEDPMEVTMQLTGTEGSLHYGFERFGDQSGSIRFDVVADLLTLPDFTTAKEKLTILSRWTPTGAGRADMTVTGGDLGTSTANGVECWDTDFRVVYGRPLDGKEPTVGDAQACTLPAP